MTARFDMKPKKILTILVCLAVIAACGVWIWRTRFNQPKFSVPLHLGLGQAMAELTASAGATGRIVIITLPARQFPELAVQVKEFKRVLSVHRGLSFKEYELETEDRPKFQFGTGLSGRRYLRIVNKNLSASAIVSFVGAPELKEKEAAEIKSAPRFIAECRTADKLQRLFELKALHAALVGRYEYPSPVKGTPRTPSDWVAQRFQIVTAENAASLPVGSGDTDVAPPNTATPAAKTPGDVK